MQHRRVRDARAPASAPTARRRRARRSRRRGRRTGAGSVALRVQLAAERIGERRGLGRPAELVETHGAHRDPGPGRARRSAPPAPTAVARRPPAWPRPDRRRRRARGRTSRRATSYRRAPIASATERWRSPGASGSSASARRACAKRGVERARAEQRPRVRHRDVGRVGHEPPRAHHVRPHRVLGKERDRSRVGPRQVAFGRLGVPRDRPLGQPERLASSLYGSASLR